MRKTVNKRLLAALLACALPLTLLPGVALADDVIIDHNPVGTTILVLSDGYTLTLNEGNVTTVQNGGRVERNTGGAITTVQSGGLVGTNYGDVDNNYGTVETNPAEGHVSQNLGTVTTNDGRVANNSGKVTNSPTGVVHNNNAGGVVHNYGGTVTSNNGTVNEYYTVAASDTQHMSMSGLETKFNLQWVGSGGTVTLTPESGYRFAAQPTLSPRDSGTITVDSNGVCTLSDVHADTVVQVRLVSLSTAAPTGSTGDGDPMAYTPEQLAAMRAGTLAGQPGADGAAGNAAAGAQGAAGMPVAHVPATGDAPWWVRVWRLVPHLSF